MAAAADTSRPLVGSSATRNSGLSASARAMPTRRAWPPESSCGYLLACSDESSTIASNSSTLCCSLLRYVVDAVWLGQQIRDAQARAEAGVRILEDHLGAAAQPAQAAARQTSNVLPVEHDSARGRGREPEDRPAERRLAGARTRRRARRPPRGAARDRRRRRRARAGDGRPVRRASEPAAVVEVGAQRLDAHERLARHGRCGRARVRTDGPGGALSDDARRYDPSLATCSRRYPLAAS